MKKLLFFIPIILLIFTQSCKTIELSQIPKQEIFSGIDFREYTKKNFLFTPEKFIGDYESIGIVSFLIMPEANKDSKFEPNTKNGKAGYYTSEWTVKDIDIQNAIEGIYKHCVEMGADALVNFKSDIQIVDYSYLIPPLKLQGYQITGFAIKRK